MDHLINESLMPTLGLIHQIKATGKLLKKIISIKQMEFSFMNLLLLVGFVFMALSKLQPERYFGCMRRLGKNQQSKQSLF